MIQFALTPNRIQLEQTTQVTLRITNAGNTPVIGLHFYLEAPKPLLLLGQQKGKIELLDPGQTYEFNLTLKAKNLGTVELKFTRLSYRTVYGQVGHQSNDTLKLEVFEPYVPKISLTLLPLSCLFEQWVLWEGKIKNQSDGSLKNIKILIKEETIELRHPILIDELSSSESITLSLIIRAHELGTFVPVSLVVFFEEAAGYKYKSLFSYSIEVRWETLTRELIHSSGLLPNTSNIDGHDGVQPCLEINDEIEHGNLLYAVIMKYFNLTEINDLCFHLGIDHEIFAIASKSEKIREIIRYCQRRGLSKKLVQTISKLRPDITTHL